MANVRLVKLTRDSIMSWGRSLFTFLSKQNQEKYADYLLPLDGNASDYTQFMGKLSSLISNQDIALNDNHVPTDYWLVVLNGAIIGTAKTRYLLDATLVHEGGHVRIGLDSDYRKKGYGIQVLALLFEECKKNHKLTDVLLTTLADNSAANNLIIGCGGTLESVLKSRQYPGKDVALYWVHI